MSTLVQDTSACTSPLITFIVPTYNVSFDLLTECVGSLLTLPLQDGEREIIVVDDGSDEPVAPRLHHYGDTVTCFRQNNRGLSAARNAGLKLAHGQYVQFVDSDDYLLKEPYTECLKVMREQRPDLLMFRHTHHPNALSSYRCSLPVSGADYLCKHNLRAAAWGYLFRRDLLGTLRFHEGIFHEDEEFTPQLFLRAKNLIEIQAAAYFYRQRPDSIVRDRRRWRVLRRLVDFRSVIVSLNQLSETYSGQEREGLKRRVAQLTMDYHYNILHELRSLRTLRNQTAWLRRRQLFPLPIKNYSRLYAVFSVLTRILFI